MGTLDEPVDDAVRVLRDMPANMQARAARAILDYAAGDDDLAPGQ